MKVLDQVPDRWQEVPLWSAFERIKDVGHPDEPMLSVFREHGVVRKDSLPNLNVTAENRNIYQLVDSGWLVVNRMKAWQGAVGIAQQRGIVSGHYICFRPRGPECEPRFLNWLLRSAPYVAAYRAVSRGVRPGQAEIDNDELRVLKLVLPPLEEQRRIADFLETQVSALDRIIDLRQEQTGLLAERALAFVSDLLAPPARGAHGRPEFPWLADDGTLLVKLGRVCDLQSGLTLDAKRPGGSGYPYLRVANVQDGWLDLDEVKYVNVDPDAATRWMLRPGDVLMTEGGDLDKLGRGTVWSGEIDNCLHQNHLFALRPHADALLPEFLAAMTRTHHARRYFEMTGNRTTNLASTNSSKILAFRFPLPDLEEQRALLKRVQEVDEASASAMRLMREQTGLLRERKQALITAAVTGALDATTARSAA